jgi:hypothetical protein
MGEFSDVETRLETAIDQLTTDFVGIYAASGSARSSDDSAEDVPPDLSIPRWSWDGRQP